MGAMTDDSGRESGALDLALSKLREMVVTGVLSPGEQVRQQEIADRLGVSRVPLREALNVLARQGLLLHRPHQGYFVAKRLPLELAQLRLMLEVLENELIKSLRWPDERALAELDRLNARMLENAQRDDWMDLLQFNRQFHFRIFALSPYRLVLDQVERLWDLAEPFIAGKLALREARIRTCEEHTQLIQALRRQDRPACVEVLRLHRSSTVSGLQLEMPESAQAPMV